MLWPTAFIIGAVLALTCPFFQVQAACTDLLRPGVIQQHFQSLEDPEDDAALRDALRRYSLRPLGVGEHTFILSYRGNDLEVTVHRSSSGSTLDIVFPNAVIAVEYARRFALKLEIVKSFAKKGWKEATATRLTATTNHALKLVDTALLRSQKVEGNHVRFDYRDGNNTRIRGNFNVTEKVELSFGLGHVDPGEWLVWEKDVSEMDRRRVIVSGESGVGKETLLRELARRDYYNPALWLNPAHFLGGSKEIDVVNEMRKQLLPHVEGAFNKLYDNKSLDLQTEPAFRYFLVSITIEDLLRYASQIFSAVQQTLAVFVLEAHILEDPSLAYLVQALAQVRDQAVFYFEVTGETEAIRRYRVAFLQEHIGSAAVYHFQPTPTNNVTGQVLGFLLSHGIAAAGVEIVALYEGSGQNMRRFREALQQRYFPGR